LKVGIDRLPKWLCVKQALALLPFAYPDHRRLATFVVVMAGLEEFD
jgi:hypothetical protein